MEKIQNENQLRARYLYFNENISQQEIAQAVGVTPRTLYNWIRQFSWHQQREVANSTMALIADNIGGQLLDFQQVIARREKEDRCPTPQEIALQDKLISGLVRMKKYPRKGQVTEYLENFLHFADAENDAIGNTLFGIYEKYIGREADTARNRKEKENKKPENTNEKTAVNPSGKGIDPVSGALPQPEKTGKKAAAETLANTPLRVTAEDFEKYKHYLGSDVIRNVEHNYSMKVGDRYLDKIWLEYNMFQYCLPTSERKFIWNIVELEKEVGREEMYAKIDEYLKTNKSPSMAA